MVIEKGGELRVPSAQIDGMGGFQGLAGLEVDAMEGDGEERAQAVVVGVRREELLHREKGGREVGRLIWLGRTVELRLDDVETAMGQRGGEGSKEEEAMGKGTGAVKCDGKREATDGPKEVLGGGMEICRFEEMGKRVPGG